MFSHSGVTPLIGPPYWITAHGLYPILPCKLAKFRINLEAPRTEFKSWKHSVICIFNKTTEEYNHYNVKTSENDVKQSDFNTGEMDKSRELYSKEGDNSSQFEGKTVPWEHTIISFIFPSQKFGNFWIIKN